ncbi:hypothetical protein ACLEYV_19995, partial [Escherichia coli]
MNQQLQMLCIQTCQCKQFSVDDLIGSVALRLRQVTCCFFVMLPIVTVNVSDPKYLQTSALSRRRYC